MVILMSLPKDRFFKVYYMHKWKHTGHGILADAYFTVLFWTYWTEA
jgi:hypothetical protein